MSLLAFQLALADMTASPAFCRRVAADPEAALAGYELTPVERRRLAAAAGQPGMQVNFTLYRYNRIVTLATVLPGTLHLLGAEARAVADEFWAEHGPDRNMRRESERFAAVVRGALERGRLSSPYLREVVDYEMMRYELGMTPPPHAAAAQADGDPGDAITAHPLVRVATFAHDPRVLLPHLAAKHPLPYDDVPEGEYHLLLECRASGLVERLIDAQLARVILAAAAGEEVDPSPELDELIAAGLLIGAVEASVR